MKDGLNDGSENPKPKKRPRPKKRTSAASQMPPKPQETDDVLAMIEAHPLVVPIDMEPFELEYRLPSLRGTDTEVYRGRLIRRDYLRPLFQKLTDVTEGMQVDEAKDILFTMDCLRGEPRATVWIEVLRPHLGVDAVTDLRAISKLLERQRERTLQKQELQRKAAEGRQLAQIADAFADQHDLPRLQSPVCSRPQESFGRRCRHEILIALSETELAAVLPVARTVVDPCIWIGANGKSNPLEYVQQQALRRKTENDPPQRHSTLENQS